MDAITLLKNEHREIERLFKQFEQAGDRAFVEKRRVVDKIIEGLSKHAAIEEQLFYPVARATVPETEDIALESMEEHHIVKWLLHELETLDPQHERFDAKVTVLMENVRHHVKEEEQDFFPKVREALGRSALAELGDTMEEFEKIAPTHPHPRSPDAPPANIVVGIAAGVADRVTDTVSGVAQGAASAAQEVVARVRGQERAKVASPTGSSTTRKIAADLRWDAVDITDAAIAAARAARDTVEETVDTARSGVKGAATAARNGAESTVTTARNGAQGTASAARTGAKRTATSARSTAKRTTTAAKSAATKTANTAKRGAKRTTTAAKQRPHSN